MKTAYSGDQMEANYPDGINLHWWFLARSRIIAAWTIRHASHDRPVLEVGCGRGMTVRSLREAGIDCSGVEPANVSPVAGVEEHVQSGREALDLTESKRRLYGTILLLDVIEHLPEPAEFLRDLADGFPCVSRILVTVPARQELWTNYDDYFGHQRRYTPGMLEDLASALDWDLLGNRYFFHLPYAPLWLMARLRRKRTTRPQPPLGARRAAHRGIAWAMIVDYHVIPGNFAGTSLIACFQIKGRDAILSNRRIG